MGSTTAKEEPDVVCAIDGIRKRAVERTGGNDLERAPDRLKVEKLAALVRASHFFERPRIALRVQGDQTRPLRQLRAARSPQTHAIGKKANGQGTREAALATAGSKRTQWITKQCLDEAAICGWITPLDAPMRCRIGPPHVEGCRDQRSPMRASPAPLGVHTAAQSPRRTPLRSQETHAGGGRQLSEATRYGSPCEADQFPDPSHTRPTDRGIPHLAEEQCASAVLPDGRRDRIEPEKIRDALRGRTCKIGRASCRERV